MSIGMEMLLTTKRRMSNRKKTDNFEEHKCNFHDRTAAGMKIHKIVEQNLSTVGS